VVRPHPLARDHLVQLPVFALVVDRKGNVVVLGDEDSAELHVGLGALRLKGELLAGLDELVLERHVVLLVQLLGNVAGPADVRVLPLDLAPVVDEEVLGGWSSREGWCLPQWLQRTEKTFDSCGRGIGSAECLMA